MASPKHLQSLGLVQKSVDDTAHDINFLFAMAIDKVLKFPSQIEHFPLIRSLPTGGLPSFCFGDGDLALGCLQQTNQQGRIQLPLVAAPRELRGY